MPSVSIIGGGVAGYTLARELRRQGYAGALTLSDAQGLPYDRPPLSKALAIEPFAPQAWYAEHGITLRHESVARLALPQAPDDWVVLATGSTVRRLAVPGAQHAHALHSAADAQALATALQDGQFGQRVLVIGAGLVGAEFASTARQAGAQVTLVSNSEAPLAHVLGAQLAARLHADHAAHGVRTLIGSVQELGEGYALIDGERHEAELIVAAIGVLPDTTLAKDAGLAVDDGILVDDAQRCLSHRQVLAIGDAARVQHRPRAVHWEAAMEDAAIAAATILGRPAPARAVPWFWSDRHEMHVETVGDFSRAVHTVTRSNRRGQIHTVFGLDAEGVLVSASMVDGGLMAKAARKLIARGAAPERSLLEDPAVGPRELGRVDA